MATFSEMKENLKWIDTPDESFAVVIAISYRQNYLDDLDEKGTKEAWEEFHAQFVDGRNYQKMIDEGAMLITSGFAVSEEVDDPIISQEEFALAIPATLDFVAEINVKWRERLAYGVRVIIESNSLLAYPTEVVTEGIEDGSPDSDNPDIILEKFDTVEVKFASIAEQMYEVDKEEKMVEEQLRLDEERRRQEEMEAEENRPLTADEQIELEQVERDDLKADLQDEMTENLIASFPIRELESVQIKSNYLDDVDNEGLSKNLKLLVGNLQKEVDQQTEIINSDLKQKRIGLLNRYRPTLMTDLDDMFDNIERQTLLKSETHPEADNEYTKSVDELEEQYDENKRRLGELVDEQEQIAINQFERQRDEFIEEQIKRLKHQFTEENYEQLVDDEVTQYESEKLSELDSEFDKRINLIEVQAENKYFDISETIVPRVMKSNRSWLEKEQNKYSEDIDNLLSNFQTTLDSKTERMDERISDIIIEHNTASLLRKQEIEDEVKARTPEYDKMIEENERLKRENEERLKEAEKKSKEQKEMEENFALLTSRIDEMSRIDKNRRENDNELRYQIAEYAPQVLDNEGNPIQPRSEMHKNEIANMLEDIQDTWGNKLSKYSTNFIIGAIITALIIVGSLFYVGKTQVDKTDSQIQQQNEQHEEQMKIQNQRLDELEDMILLDDQVNTDGSLDDLELDDPVVVEQGDEEVEMTVTEITEDGRVIVENEDNEEFELIE